MGIVEVNSKLGNLIFWSLTISQICHGEAQTALILHKQLINNE